MLLEPSSSSAACQTRGPAPAAGDHVCMTAADKSATPRPCRGTVAWSTSHVSSAAVHMPLGAALLQCQTGMCCAVRFLVADGSLERVTAHMRRKDLQSLRATCRALRHDAAVLGRLDNPRAHGLHWFEAAIHLPFLLQLPNLSRLCIYDADSLFRVHELSRLSRLQELLIYSSGMIDVTPLEQLTSLRSLELAGDRVACLGALSRLSQLPRLNLDAETAGPGLEKLVSLRQLQLWHLNHTAEAVALPALSQVELGEAGQPTLAEGEAFQNLQQMHALRALVTHGGPILTRGALQLTQLTALRLELDEEEDRVDLTALTGLKLLDASYYYSNSAQPTSTVTAPSVTCIRLRLQGEVSTAVQLPKCTYCGSLSHLQLEVDFLDVIITTDGLPAQHVSIAARLLHSRLFPQWGATRRFQVQECEGLPQFPS